MADDTIENTPRRRWQALYTWLTGATRGPVDEATTGVRPSPRLPARIGHYAVTRKIGEGGMGIVYAARDERLQRAVAIKRMSALARDDLARQRFWREARAAASVNHPNICQIYDVGEHDGELFLAMELLDGEVLADRLGRGPMTAAEALAVAEGMLAALGALHSRGIVHRDLKPSNVFLTPHGVKLLDFGLARPGADATFDESADLTRTGMVVGTPRYMAPEQLDGEGVDARTDLFAAGAILFEMLAGRPAFAGRTLADVLHATRFEQPPALSGSPAVTAIDRIVRRALAKRREDRHDSAESMAGELRAIHGLESADAASVAQAFTRLVVLPFRVLRPDSETDFLAFSLADAVATSLSAVDSLVVRSSAVGARFGGETPDLKGLAAEADVDRVVLGTLLRVGDQLRATAQLVDAQGGTLLASLTVQSSLGDLFGLQDDMARQIASALALPLAGPAPAPADKPHEPHAYELYLRGNELARTYAGLHEARELYRRSLEVDARFAPAWAHLGRCHRVLGKYVEGAPDSEARAEEAFRRALALNPRLAIAHKFYAQLEADMGRAEHAIARLLDDAARHGNDPELFAGLVHVCRYAGLFEESIAAHFEARRLDPNVPTSFDQTLLMAGETERLMAVQPPPVLAGADDGIRVIALGLAGRREEAVRRLGEMRQLLRIPAFKSWIDYLAAWLDSRPDDMTAQMASFASLKIADDPEAVFQAGWLLCDVGRHAEGFVDLRRAVNKGYYPVGTLAKRSQFDALRGESAFEALMDDARAGRDRALAVFRQAGGERFVGVRAA